MKIISLVFLLLSSSFLGLLHAEELGNIRFTHIGLEHGLSHSTIFAINQDPEGSLWIATYDGLNKYDGYHFTIYRHQEANPHSIASDITRCLAIEEDGRLWVGTREGLSLYNRQKNIFVNYCHKKNEINVTVTSIVPLKKDYLLVGSMEGLLLFDAKQGRFRNDTLASSLYRLSPTVMERHGEDIYIGVKDGVWLYNISTNHLDKLVELPADSKIHAILHQMFDKLWVATEGDGLYLYDLKSKQLKNYRYNGGKSGLNSNYVRSLAVDEENRLWIGTYSGLNIYKEATDSFESIKSSEIQEGSLSQNSVRSLFRDSQGGMWLGTYWGGLNYYHPLCNRFQHIKHLPYLNSLSNNVVNCIVEDNRQNLWIGTSDGGLNFYDGTSRQFKRYALNAGNLDLPFKDIKSVYVDELQDIVYVGAHAGGMMALHRKTGYVEYFNKHNSNLSNNNIYSIISDEQGGLWVASLDNLLHFDLSKRTFKVIDQDENKDGRPKYRLLFRDSKKKIWAGGEAGLSVFTQTGTKLSLDTDFKSDSLLRQAFVNCFFESSSGQLWIGTRSGLFAFKKDYEPICYTTANGLPSNVIYGILEDAFGRLWISTNLGLSCMNTENGRFRNFTVLDGLQSNQFNAGAYCRKDNGNMLFGGINGITAFRPETLIDNPYAPKPIINKLFVYNKEIFPNDETGILQNSLEYTDRIVLTSSQNSFALSFVVSNFIAGRHNTFAYQLKGYDDEWYKLSDISLVSYSNLPPGNYTFCVKAANNDGKWNEDYTALKIRILPVWYCTWWALLLFTIILAGIVYAVVRFFWQRKSMQAQIQMERLDKEKQEEISQMKIRFYVNISHELRTPLTLIIAPLQELLHRISGHWEHEKLLYIQRNTNHLLHLVNQLMDFRRAELGIFELRAVWSNAYQRVLNCYLNYESLAKRKDIDYNFYSELQDEKMLFDENYMDLIVNNLLSNAFKYTEVGKSVTIKLYKEKNQLVLQVADTGIGIPPEKQKKIFERFYQLDSNKVGSGIGLSLVQRLVELHHGTIELTSEVGKGSIFTIRFPQDEAAYSQEELLGDNNETDNNRGVYSTNAHDIYVGEEELLQEGEEEETDEEEKKRGIVLVVEDNKELRQYLKSGLSSLFTVFEAEHGAKALDILKEQEVDLIITDVMMPVMDGVKFCKAVKQNLRTCHIPVYMLSAKADVKYQLEGLQVGADDYIAKPFSVEVLRAKILNLLRTRYRTFERYSKATEVEPEKLTNNTMDEELLRKAITVIEKNMDNVEFSAEQFAREMGMSRSGLHLKLKAITGKSTIDFIHKIRFNRACQLLKEEKYTVAEISYMVGYNTPSYFAARFKKYIGCLPTEYVKK